MGEELPHQPRTGSRINVAVIDAKVHDWALLVVAKGT
jgi:hypothetical protein